jgi:pimeloyl-ACP methyl ester carboxylesterase
MMRRALTGIFIGIALLGLLCGGLYILGTRQIAVREPEHLDHVRNQISGRFLEVQGRRIHIVEQGVGPTLLLVHGFAASTFDWEEAVLPALAHEYHVVALDLYGMGFSERNDDLRYGFALWATQLRDTLDALAIDRVTVVGHSLGGAVATLFAAEHPERVDRLVLVAALAPAGIREAPWWAFVLLTPGVGEFFAEQLEYFTPPGFSAAYYERARSIYRLAGTRRAMLRYVRGGADFPRLLAAYPRIQAPTLILHGTADEAVPYGTATRVKPLLQQVQMVTAEGGSHWLYRDKPEWVVAEIRTFLQSSH